MAARKKPTGEDLEKLISEYEQGIDIRLLAERFSIRIDTMKHWMHEEGAKRRGNVDCMTVSFENPPSYDEILEIFKKASLKMRSLHSVGLDVSKEIPTDRPIALMFWADWHIGNLGTDYESLEEDVEIVRAVDNLYCYIGGNMMDWFSRVLGSPAAGGVNQLPPMMQQTLFRKCVERIGIDNIIAMGVGAGCHEDWNRIATGWDFMNQFAERVGIIYTQSGGLLRLKVGEQQYNIFRVHKSRFNSSFNLTHTVKRMWEFAPCDFDIGVAEHRHESSFEPFTRHGVEKIAIRTGTYLVWDDYARRNSFYGMQPNHPCVVLYPDRRKIVPFGNISDAVSYLKRS